MVVVLSKVRHTGLYRRTQLSLVRYGMSVASGMHNPRVLSWRKKVERGIIDLFEGIEPPRSLQGDRPPKSLRGDLPPKDEGGCGRCGCSRGLAGGEEEAVVGGRGEDSDDRREEAAGVAVVRTATADGRKQQAPRSEEEGSGSPARVAVAGERGWEVAATTLLCTATLRQRRQQRG
ncbi:hypothetical protein BHM03_00045472 [Ensete ventricosum]|nr:hypothetical protein BHM03_00045472 [Ensete ventricosum]